LATRASYYEFEQLVDIIANILAKKIERILETTNIEPILEIQKIFEFPKWTLSKEMKEQIIFC